MTVIKAKNINHNFNSLMVLRDISFDINQGEFVSIIGPSGCGKTTLLKILGALLTPDSGRVTIRGDSVKRALKAHELGFIFQNPVLFPWRTLKQNVQLPFEIMENKSLMNTDKLLKMLNLQSFGDYYPNKLSGGMKQRVTIARALIYDPKILLMDEPFGSLDELTREVLNIELLKIWKETRKTIIFITHSISEAVFLSSKVLVLSDRPAEIVCIEKIDLPYPRNISMKESKKYLNYVSVLRNKLLKV